MAAITPSIANMPWGPPKPRKAVLDTVFVRQRCEVMRTAGRKYALSQWNTARSFTAPERSAEMPQREASISSSEASPPSPSQPAS